MESFWRNNYRATLSLRVIDASRMTTLSLANTVVEFNALIELVNRADHLQDLAVDTDGIYRDAFEVVPLNNRLRGLQNVFRALKTKNLSYLKLTGEVFVLQDDFVSLIRGCNRLNGLSLSDWVKVFGRNVPGDCSLLERFDVIGNQARKSSHRLIGSPTTESEEAVKSWL